jgi:hypothetical protein
MPGPFASRAAARTTGKTPMLYGQPGYGLKLGDDRDGRVNKLRAQN